MRAHSHLPFAARVSNFLEGIDPFEACSQGAHDAVEQIAAEALVEGTVEDVEMILQRHGACLSVQLTDDIKSFLACGAAKLAA